MMWTSRGKRPTTRWDPDPVTPGARIQAAIDILNDLEQTGLAADRYFKNWAAKNRYAGSKDRRYLRELVFHVLRHRASFEGAMGAATPRALALAGARWGMEASAEEIASCCNGDGHNAQPLSGEELAALQADTAPEVVEWPVWALEELKPGRTDDQVEELALALTDIAPLDLRVNTAKIDRKTTLAALEAVGFAAKPTPFSPIGIRIARSAGTMDGQNVRALPLFNDGRIEVQDEASQIAALLAGAKSGQQVIELCAGGGGKTLVLGAAMGRSGQIIACDVDERRLKSGQARVKRAGLHNVQPKLIADWSPDGGAADPDLEDFAGKADLVLLDVPCSGSGAWRRQPEGKWNLDTETIDKLVETQRGILKRGARLVKPGGRLAYVTCSVFQRENGAQVDWFLGQAPDFALENIPEAWEADVSNPFPLDLNEALGEPGWLQLSPTISGTDGFFIALMRRAPNP